MSGRADPVRIYEAHRAGNLNRLIREGELPDRAEALIATQPASGSTLRLTSGGRLPVGSPTFAGSSRRAPRAR